MEIKKVEVQAKLIITVQSKEKITEEEVKKAILFTELNINNQCGFGIVDTQSTTAFYRCHIDV